MVGAIFSDTSSTGIDNKKSLTVFRNESDHISFVKRLVTGYTIYKRPGDVFTYSNIGFMFLGRVIEEITGSTYEHFIQREVLKPIGIVARIGDQFPGENEVNL